MAWWICSNEKVLRKFFDFRSEHYCHESLVWHVFKDCCHIERIASFAYPVLPGGIRRVDNLSSCFCRASANLPLRVNLWWKANRSATEEDGMGCRSNYMLLIRRHWNATTLDNSRHRFVNYCLTMSAREPRLAYVRSKYVEATQQIDSGERRYSIWLWLSRQNYI